ncbi:MAG: MFS transporter [Flavihumibacter sp.]
MSNTFRVFHYRNYSYFFFGQLVSRLGTWMQRTAVLWVVYQMTHSLLMVGIATFAEQFPSFVLSPLAGITADRYNRNKVVIVTQLVSALQAVLLTLFYFIGWHYVWLILGLSLVLGIANAFDIPARQAMVNELVEDPALLPGAIAMNASMNNFARLAGPALAGLVLAVYGASACFAANALSFTAVIYCLFQLKVPPLESVEKGKKTWSNFREGLNYIKTGAKSAPRSCWWV